MLNINEQVKQDITYICERIRKIESTLSHTDVLDEEQVSQIAYTCTELSLLAFAASDNLAMNTTPEDRLIVQEVSSALWQIAVHCIDIQEWTDNDVLRAAIGAVGQHCTGIARMLNLTDSEVDTPDPDDLISKALQIQEQQSVQENAARFSTALTQAAPAEDQVEKLKREIKILRDILASLVLKRDNMLLVESKELTARYMKELGNLETEVFYAETDARYLQRKYEMMQAAANRQAEIRTEEIDKKLKEAFEEFQKVFEEFMRKAAESAEAARKRKERVENSDEGINKEKTTQKSTGDKAGQDETESGTEEQSPEDKKEDIATRLKKLYRKIVKAMHPDLHPDQDERERELFKKANQAYEDGDLQTLEEIEQIIGGGTPKEGKNLLAALLEEKQRLLKTIQGIRAQITHILGQYPFTKKALLNDPVKLKAEQESLKARLARAKKSAAIYQAKIEEMELQKNGRTDSEG